MRSLLVLTALTGTAAADGKVVDFHVITDGCVILGTGEVACWGPTFKSDKPKVVAGIAHATRLGSVYGIYVVLDDGTLRYPGSDAHVKLPHKVIATDSGYSIVDGGRVLEGIQEDSRLLDGVTEAVALAAGEHHTCFVRKDGTIACTGSNGYGQLGAVPKRKQDNPDLPTGAQKPALVPGIADAVGVAAGSEHTCALHRDGTVDCFGSGYQGNLGDGEDGGSIRRARVAKLADATAIAADGGGWTTCALRKTGAIRCWGMTGDWMPRDTAVTGFDLPALGKVTRIALSNRHVCALVGDAEVRCIGELTGPDGKAATTKSWRKVYP